MTLQNLPYVCFTARWGDKPLRTLQADLVDGGGYLAIGIDRDMEQHLREEGMA